MQSSLHSGVLVVLGCLAALTAVVTLPAPTVAAQSANENRSADSQLFRAVQANDLAAVQASIGEGADIEARDRWGMTPTDIAIDRGHYRIAHFLVSVRNNRRAQDGRSTASTWPAAEDTAHAPAVRQESSSTETSMSAVPAAKPDSRPHGGDESVAAWPAGKPNPFDPTVPALGSQLRSVQGGR